MSHELRTPLNSILILSQQLADNASGNLSTKQVDFARNVHSSGSDLLNLINDILDLSKIESGTVTVEVEEIPFAGLRDTIDRNFRHVAENKNLPFHVQFDPDLPRALISDSKRLQQILKNLLSNAVKFTAQGHVRRACRVRHVWLEHRSPRPEQVATGHCVRRRRHGNRGRAEKQRLIFEAFQQGDAGTSRKYGGTGLGLAISRELAMLLGGEIRLTSVHGQGSTFTLYLPLRYRGPDTPPPAALGRGSTDQTKLPAARVLSVAREEQILDDRENIDRRRLRSPRDRGRPSSRAHSAGVGARQGLQGDRGHARAQPASPSPGSLSPTPSPSTSTCPICSAGPCSTTSSRTRPCDISRCRSSRSTRSASLLSLTGRSRTWSSRRPPRASRPPSSGFGNSPLRAPNGSWSSRTMKSNASRSSSCSTTQTSS